MKPPQYSYMIDSMPNKHNFSLYFAHLALAISLILPASMAAAQSPPTPSAQAEQVILWTFRAPDAPAESIEKISRGLAEALPNKGARHLFGEKALQEYVGAKTAPPADCLIGLETCVSPQTLTVDALGLALVIHVEITRSGTQWVGEGRWVDRRGEVAGRATLKAGSARDLAFEL